MRIWVGAIGAGLVGLVVKTWLAFHLWLIPLMIDAVNAGVVLVLVLLLGFQASQRKPLTRLAALTALFAIALCSVPTAYVVGKARISNARAYCEALGRCADRHCPSLTSSQAIPALPGRSIPVLFRPGYSRRYRPHFRADAAVCEFPDAFPGRDFWSGARGKNGNWTWENVMD